MNEHENQQDNQQADRKETAQHVLADLEAPDAEAIKGGDGSTASVSGTIKIRKPGK